MTGIHRLFAVPAMLVAASMASAETGDLPLAAPEEVGMSSRERARRRT